MNPMDQFLSNRTRKVISGRVSRFARLVLLLICVCSPCMAAPLDTPIWVNPCGGNVPPSGPHHDADITPPSDQELLTGIIISAKNALGYAQQFSEEYVRVTFKTDFRDHHNAWVHSGYTWLPSKKDIPKDLGTSLDRTHFEELEGIDKTLLRSYQYLQRLAVGLEQVYHDKRREQDQFSEQFETVMYKLRQVLCEVNTALSERNPNVAIEDIERSIMEPTLRSISEKTYRHLRDWFIFRDFMNCLEYLIEVCQFYKEADKSS